MSKSEWGKNAFTNLFGADEKLWKQFDATELVSSYHGPMPNSPPLIQVGSDDPFAKQLMIQNFIEACAKASFPIEYREENGYDHGYYFIMTFIEEHFKYHKKEFQH